MVQPDIRLVLSSAEDGGEDTDKGGDTESIDMDTQEPQTSEGNTPMPMDLKEERPKTPSPRMTSDQQKKSAETATKTFVARHSTRPLRERRPPNFLGERFCPSAATTGTSQVNAVYAQHDTSDKELG